MSEEINTRPSRRYVVLDIHKYYCVVAGVNRDGKIVLQPVRVEHADLEGWLKKNLQKTDDVVIESTTNAWHVYDLLEPLAERVVVANPIKVKQIATARVKDERGKRFNEQNTGWQKDMRLSQIEQFQMSLEMENREYIEKQIERIGVEVKKICHQKPWSDSMAYVMSLPGFGVITAMTVLAAIGEIERFETPKKLASYSGLTPGLEQSGTKNRGKGITKEGRRELRWALVEAALQAVKSDLLLKQRFNEQQKRMHRNQAIVSIARHLLELVWYVLTRRQLYRGFTQERIAYKYLTWAWQMKDPERDGLTRQQFARYYLMRLGIGKDLTRIALDPKHPRRLASEAEVLALRPELRQIE